MNSREEKPEGLFAGLRMDEDGALVGVAAEFSAGRARCTGCGYLLRGLSTARCPECGRPFDPSDAKTFSTQMPLTMWWLWAPGVAGAFALGLAVFLTLIGMETIGWAITLAAPISLGVYLGYFVRLQKVALTLVALSVLIGLLATLFSLSLVGMLCSLISLVVVGLPIIFGAVAGWYLARHLRRRGIEEGKYLPFLMMAGSVIWGAVESRGARTAWPVTTTTARVFDMPVGEVWKRLRFYEQINGPRPLLMRLAGPKPRAVVGARGRVGDEVTCVYDRGFVRKRITRVDAPHVLAFDVLEHHIGEDRTMKLMRGEFVLTALDERRTQVEVSTTYDALLRPRFAWYPFEAWVTHTLHGYILDGIAAPEAGRELAMVEAADGMGAMDAAGGASESGREDGP